jgi:hypothetical protein
VPAAKLASFTATTGEQIDGPKPGPGSAILPAGKRPYYCLTRAAISKSAKVIAATDYDFCADTPLLATRDSGRLLVSAVALEGSSDMGLASPIYRGGGVPATVSERRCAACEHERRRGAGAAQDELRVRVMAERHGQ